jgi:predicted O-methyltransferase YrrM
MEEIPSFELGTSAGLGAAYLYSLSHAEIHTVEGRQEIFEIAEETKSKLGISSMQCYCGLFEEQMENLEMHGLFDLVFIDGNHKAEPSKLYVNWAKQHLTESGLIILDDIYWSKEMTQAWEDIRSQTDVKLSLDFYHFGVIGYHPSFLQAQHFNLKWPLF